MSSRLEYPSVRAVLYCITAQSEGTEDEDNNNHAGCGACAFELLIRRSRRPSRQKKPALGRRPAHQSADIARPVFARRYDAVQNDTQHELEQLVWRGQRPKRVPRQTSVPLGAAVSGAPPQVQIAELMVRPVNLV